MTTPLREIAVLFLRLGTTAFGGPAAHIAMMEDEVVRRRRWLTPERFLDLLGATNLIPGPNSTEMAIHIGRERAGLPGLVVAGVCFILPAASITLAFAFAYVRFGSLPQAEGLLYGVKPAIIAIVVQALVSLFPKAVKGRFLGVLGAAAAAASLAGANELVLLLLSGAAAAVAARVRSGPVAGGTAAGSAGVGLLAAGGAGAGTGAGIGAGAGAGAGPAAVGLGPLFLLFLKIGSILYGSGYVLLAFLRADLVLRRGWLSEQALLDSVAVGQVTPGPVFTTATFIGYVLAGVPGAAVATVGIFLPGFVLVALSGRLVPRIRRSPTAGAFLDGVNVASLALMAAVTVTLGRAAVVDAFTAGLAAAAAILLLRFRVNSVWLVVGGGAVGLIARL